MVNTNQYGNVANQYGNVGPASATPQAQQMSGMAALSNVGIAQQKSQPGGMGNVATGNGASANQYGLVGPASGTPQAQQMSGMAGGAVAAGNPQQKPAGNTVSANGQTTQSGANGQTTQSGGYTGPTQAGSTVNQPNTNTPGSLTFGAPTVGGTPVGGGVGYSIKGIDNAQNLQNPNPANYTAVNANQINNQIAGIAGQTANLQQQSQAKDTTLGPTSTYGASQISPLAILGQATQAATTNAQAANINTAQSNQILGQQQNAVNNLSNIANGNGPNAATIAAQQQGQQNTASMMGAIASAGGNPALAMRNAANNTAQQNQQVAANAVLGSANEQLGAQSTLQSALGNMEGQQQQGAQAQAGLQQQAALQNAATQSQAAQQQAALTNSNLQANQQIYTTQAGMDQSANAANAAAQNASTLQQGSMNQQTSLQNANNMLQAGTINAQQYNAMVNANMSQSSFETAQNENYSNAYLQNQNNLAALAAGSGIAQMNQNTAMVGAAAGGVGATIGAGVTAASASDIRAKTNIKSGNRSIQDFLSAFGEKTKPIISGKPLVFA
jgi:hypothetical protein